jgi:lysozyme
MRISQRGIDLIKRHEGLWLQAYRDSVGVITIGYGHTQTAREGQSIAAIDAEALLRDDLGRFESGVAALVIRPTSARPLGQSQFDALVSFAFNVGLDIDADRRAEGLGDSTLLALVNAGRDQEAAIEFLKWNKAGGRPLLGLTRRRQAEAQLYLEDL